MVQRPSYVRLLLPCAKSILFEQLPPAALPIEETTCYLQLVKIGHYQENKCTKELKIIM